MLQHPNQTTDVCQPVSPSGRLEPYSQSESPCLLLKPLLLHTYRPFGGGVLVFDKPLLYPTSLAGSVSIGASSPGVESTLGGVPVQFACGLLRFGLSFSSCMFPSTQAGSFSPLLKPRCCTLWSLGEGVLIVTVTARPCPSLSEVVYDVRDCFFDRHNRKSAPSKGQAWRLNKSPCNSQANHTHIYDHGYTRYVFTTSYIRT